MSADLQNDLHAEIMTEMAENFFSRRRNLEDGLDQFYRLVVRVRRVGMETLVKWHTLFRLLLCDEQAKRLFESMGAAPSDILWYCKNVNELRPMRRPLALTGLGRYVKTVERLYELLHQAAADYNNGTFAPDPLDVRKMRAIPGYLQVKELCGEINSEIKEVNEGQSPYSVLAFAKSLDPEGMQRERISGATLGDAHKIDKDLAFVPIVFEDLGLPHIPELPPLSEVRDRLVELCKGLYRAREKEVQTLLGEVWAA
ncbi:hypothetical protein [Desulfolutivibrio sulfoxidireducens]|uniref:hypothetical protein n=1 Tax=Desulfolutivibrio sulfoxidireducens TaxID=2773299 RepID=UPI00159D3473|nr:hypothetical protein [Desulfolutivibrio sulfoxidireducens]QLA14969.1 hypothetical protein GD605_01795 [Desulfolutivibrio sulfoxidireducens]QLA18536.1 hypothetical protein GD604_01730 [Desulfolutivibrio sulfoxidireducens]